MSAAPRRIPPKLVERVWGKRDLRPWFPAQESPVGEVWFEGPAALRLLIKFIYTSEKLSVQVHPADEYARAHHGCEGKTEMWHILEAEPGATIALGLKGPLSRERLREAALSGEIERLLNWEPVRAGDTLYTAAGTIHAIGAGITLCEIQQYSDVTYRLYDYGRPRELHLDPALDVASREPYSGRRPLPIDCESFRVEELALAEPREYAGAGLPEHYLIALSGSGKMGVERFSAGQVWLIPEAAAFPIEAGGAARLLRAYRPR